MAKTTINELQSLVNRLKSERQSHMSAIEEIDAAFRDLGMPAGGDGTGRRVARPRMTGGKRRKRRRFEVSGINSVYDFIKKSGSKGVTGADIDKHWDSEGRAGSAYNMLGQLVRERKVKRNKLKGQRGSIYTAT